MNVFINNKACENRMVLWNNLLKSINVIIFKKKKCSKHSGNFEPNPTKKGTVLAYFGLLCTLFMNCYIP